LGETVREKPISQREEVTMNKNNILISNLFGRIVLITIALGVLAFGIGWVIGWRTSIQYSNAYFVIGAILIGIGTLSVAGGFMFRGNYRLNYAQSAGILNNSERTNQNVSNASSTYSTLIIFTLSGLILILLSIGIDRLFR
jgi:hypothetical protein